ncbi:MAG: DUF6273 domain-containing protein [Lachnospiraceae bacterium]|nr:DUF6273 domain-containing protein [Lachnospiraceae bacterium]
MELTELLKNCKTGDVIRFGAYDWIVYAKEGNIVSVLSKEPIKKGTYHSENTPLTWEKCDLRKWLNGEFYDTFSEEEKKQIVQLSGYSEKHGCPFLHALVGIRPAMNLRTDVPIIPSLPGSL